MRIEKTKWRCGSPNRIHPMFKKEWDEWIIKDGNKICSFCGSLHPAYVRVFFNEGGEVSLTGKDYKTYIKLNNITYTFYKWHAPKWHDDPEWWCLMKNKEREAWEILKRTNNV